MPGKPLKEWISVPMAARSLGVGESAVRTLIAEGRLTVREIPPSYARVLRSEVERLAAACTISAGSRGDAG